MDERKEYSVALAVRASEATGLVADTDTADDLIDLREDLGPAVSVADRSLEVRVEVVANGSNHAYHEAWERVHMALDKLGLGDWQPERIEISSAEDLERTLAEPNMPTLIGVAEIAEQPCQSPARLRAGPQRRLPAAFGHARGRPRVGRTDSAALR